MSHFFRAPWSTKLTVMTIGALVLLAYVGVTTVGRFGSLSMLEIVIRGGVLTGVLLIAGVNALRGYRVAEGEIRIQRYGWPDRRIELTEVEKVRVDPDATAGSIRTFGIGGLFGFTGRYRNKKLGPYHSYVTDPERAVVLQLADDTVVVSPETPRSFAEAVRSQLAGAGGSTGETAT